MTTPSQDEEVASTSAEGSSSLELEAMSFGQLLQTHADAVVTAAVAPLIARLDAQDAAIAELRARVAELEQL